MDSKPDFSLDYKTLLAERAKYLEAKIAELNPYVAELQQIRDIIGISPKQQIEDNTLLIAPHHGGMDNRNVKSISQSIVKPLVEEFLSKNPGKHLTSDIFAYISTKHDVNKEGRRAWVLSISLALNTLSKGSKPRVRKSDTDNGNIMAYEWISDILTYQRDIL